MSNPPNQQQFGTGRRFDETAPPVQVSGEWSHHAARQLLQAPEVPASATQYSPAGDADFPKVPISLKIN